MSSHHVTNVRAIDHLVLPVSGLKPARERLTSLGFNVAPDARHPFGTENACVFFRDGTYLEPLAIGDPVNYRSAVTEGNPFVSRDALYREYNGPDSMSAVVARTDDAALDNERFVGAGFSDGRMLDFSRPVKMPDGSQSLASFRLAFASGKDATDLFFFSCQRVVALPGDRSALERHGNGVTGLREIILSAQNPAMFSSLASTVFGVDGVTDVNEAQGFETGNVFIRIVPHSSLSSYFGLEPVLQRAGLQGAAVVFSVADLSVTEALLAANGVAFTREHSRLLVQAAPGQGVLFAFEE